MTIDNLKQDKERKHAQQPVFTRSDSHKKGRIARTGYRNPRGWQNKMRLHKKGYRVTVKPGFGTPVKLQHCTKSGLAITTVNNLDELKAIDVKTQAAIIGNVGQRKKQELITYATENKVELVNLSLKAFQEKTQALEAKKKAKADAKAAKEAKEKAEATKLAKEAEKKKAEAKAKKAEEAKASESEDKKAEDKKEQDKVLTSKKGF